MSQTKAGSRFDYVKYDDESLHLQSRLKELAQLMENGIERIGKDFQTDVCKRSKEKAVEALEICYMWCGKAVRDAQSVRPQPLQEERVSS